MVILLAVLSFMNGYERGYGKAPELFIDKSGKRDSHKDSSNDGE